jgi:Zn finger protein HypA/HybF involved in hydrogenase expression
MVCKIHGQPRSMTCSRCADNMCPMCAEYIDGSWFCPNCAVRERRIAAGLDYQDLMSIGYGESGSGEETAEGEAGEL